MKKLLQILKANKVTVDEAELRAYITSFGANPDGLSDAEITAIANELIEQARGAIVAAGSSAPSRGRKSTKLSLPVMPLETEAANAAHSQAGMGALANQVGQTREMTGQILQGLDQEAVQNAVLIRDAATALPHTVLGLVGQALGEAGNGQGNFPRIESIFADPDHDRGHDVPAALA